VGMSHASLAGWLIVGVSEASRSTHSLRCEMAARSSCFCELASVSCAVEEFGAGRVGAVRSVVGLHAREHLFVALTPCLLAIFLDSFKVAVLLILW
jgi:hypothetical protein